MIFMLRFFMIFTLLFSVVTHAANAEILVNPFSKEYPRKKTSAETRPPVGVRPCCAFGKDLKAQVGTIPVPFFSVGNILGADAIGNHRYNDGSSNVAVNLLGLSEEKNGLLFTTRGGFIDTAHVRDTADYTYYLFQHMQQYLGTHYHMDFPAELRVRRIHWQANATPLTAEERIHLSADAAALMAFRLAQWHEIAQWFGMVSVSGFKELASAFSSEDLYSNMLGAQLAKNVLLTHPHMNVTEFGQAMDKALAGALDALDVQSAAVTDEKITALDGVWWDSSKRLPDKWTVIFRDYHFGLSLTPHYPGATHPLRLSTQSTSGHNIGEWVRLELHAHDNEAAFAALPGTLKQRSVWTVEQFQPLADFAEQQDRQALAEMNTQRE
ncbi:membrane protein [Photobacterium aphoticum]|nr:membrane protein [Photobacterium aphoticum]